MQHTRVMCYYMSNTVLDTNEKGKKYSKQSRFFSRKESSPKLPMVTTPLIYRNRLTKGRKISRHLFSLCFVMRRSTPLSYITEVSRITRERHQIRNCAGLGLLHGPGS